MSGFDAKERGAEGARSAAIDGELQPSDAAAREVDGRLDRHGDSGEGREPFGFGKAHDFECMMDQALDSGIDFNCWHVLSEAPFQAARREWE